MAFVLAFLNFAHVLFNSFILFFFLRCRLNANSILNGTRRPSAKLIFVFRFVSPFTFLIRFFFYHSTLFHLHTTSSLFVRLLRFIFFCFVPTATIMFSLLLLPVLIIFRLDFYFYLFTLSSCLWAACALIFYVLLLRTTATFRWFHIRYQIRDSGPMWKVWPFENDGNKHFIPFEWCECRKVPINYILSKQPIKLGPKCPEIYSVKLFFFIDPRPNYDSMLTKWRRRT